MADIPETSDVRHIGLVERFVGFAYALRNEGLPVGSDDVVTFVSAVAELTPTDLNDVYWSGRCTLVHRRDHLEIYDEVFRRYYLGVENPKGPTSASVKLAAPVSSGTLGVPDTEPGEDHGDDRPLILGLQASSVDIERKKRFGACTPEELAALRRIIAGIRLEPPMRRTRRRCSSPTGPVIDIRRVAREAIRFTETSAELHRLSRTHRPRPLILILDVSGSMADHSRNLLQFAYSVRRSAGKVEVFCFGTRLTRITTALDRRNPDDAMKMAASRVLDWDGGTKIGECLDDFISNWARRGMSRGATVIICSDGLDRGDPALLEDSIERLGRLCHRIIWMNPLIGNDVNALPATVAMIVSRPFVDAFESGHNLAELEAFAARLARIG